MSILIALWRARALGPAVHAASRLAPRRRRLTGRPRTRLGAAACGLHHRTHIASLRVAHRATLLRETTPNSVAGRAVSGF